MAQTLPGAAALRPDPALAPLAFLVGEWRTVGNHPDVSERDLPGRTSFAWHLGGAFLLMRSELEDPRFPAGLMLFGSDGEGRPGHAIYFDERTVARHFTVEPGHGTATWRRDDPLMSQSLTITTQGPDRLVSEGRRSENRGAWQGDLSQTFVRIG